VFVESFCAGVNEGRNWIGSKTEEGPALKRRLSSKIDPKEAEKEKEKKAKSSLIKSEERETGVISWKVLARYNAAMGGAWVVGMLFFFYIMTEVIRLSTSGWLSIWTDATKPKTHKSMFYLEVYTGLSFAQVWCYFSLLFLVSSSALCVFLGSFSWDWSSNCCPWIVGNDHYLYFLLLTVLCLFSIRNQSCTLCADHSSRRYPPVKSQGVRHHRFYIWTGISSDIV
jgi:hypothetical protein